MAEVEVVLMVLDLVVDLLVVAVETLEPKDSQHQVGKEMMVVILPVMAVVAVEVLVLLVLMLRQVEAVMVVMD